MKKAIAAVIAVTLVNGFFSTKMFEEYKEMYSNDIERLKMQYLYFSHPKNRAKNIICSKNNDIHLDNFGNIFHCVILGDKIGNIKEESIDNIWNNDLSKKSKQIIIKCNVNCHELINCGKINV